jgi:hypothetical protein
MGEKGKVYGLLVGKSEGKETTRKIKIDRIGRCGVDWSGSG